MENLDDIWQACLGELEVVLTKANFTTWFNQTKLETVDKQLAVITVPSEFSRNWLSSKYNKEIIASLQKHLKNLNQINYIVRKQTPQINRQIQLNIDYIQPENLIRQQQITVVSQSDYTFDKFVVGSNNRLAFATAKAVAQSPGRAHNPLFLYGGVGLGKTHLMRAIGYEIEQTSKKKILYVSCEDFCNEFISALQANRMESFKKKYRTVDVFLVDDIQFLSNKEGTQQEFFHTFNTLHQKNKQIVMTSDRLPRDIPNLEERLSSRFGGGMIADLTLPNFETRLAILKSKAVNKKIAITEDVEKALEYIAQNLHSNIRELEGALNRVLAWAQSDDKPITLAETQKILSEVIGSAEKKNIPPDKVIRAVARFYNVSELEIKGKKRQQEFVVPRQTAMYLIRQELDLSYPAIGKIFGGKDHTTVLHACRLVIAKSKKDDKLKNSLTLLKEKIHSVG